MLRRDLIMKQIEELAKVLAVIIGLRKAGKGNEALEQIDEALRDFLKLDTALLDAITQEELITELHGKMKLADEQVEIVARMMAERGEVLEANGETGKAQVQYTRSLHLLESLNKLLKATFSMERMQKIAELKQKLES